MSGKFIDPVQHIRRTADESLGVVPQREIVRRQESGQRFDAQSDRTQRVLTFETIEVHQFNIPANTTTTMYHLIATGASTFALSNINPDVGLQCRAVIFRLTANGPVTAGTATLELTVFEDATTTNYLISECELNTTDTAAKSVVLPFAVAPQLAKGSAWTLSIVTSAGFLPITLDMKAQVTFGYEDWASS